MVSHRSLINRAERNEAKSKHWRLACIPLVLVLASCRSFESASPTPDLVSERTSVPETSTPTPDYVTRIRNAKYQLGFVDSLRIVQLTDGKFTEGAPSGVDYVSVTTTDFMAHGDLSGDGFDEYAGVIVENYGGSGVFAFLTVFTDRNGELVYQTSTFVGDRPQLNELSIKNGEIFLDATIQKADDPMCCPTLQTTRHYKLVNNYLDMTDYVTFTPDGRPRTLTIDSPANGTEVFASIPVRGSVAIAPFENNLTYIIYDVGGVELAKGSVSVEAADPGALGTFDESILLGNVLSGAVIRIELQDINVEDGSLFAMDSVELVVK